MPATGPRSAVQAHPDVDGVLVLIDTFASGAVPFQGRKDIAIPEQMRVVTRYDGIRARSSRCRR